MDANHVFFSLHLFVLQANLMSYFSHVNRARTKHFKINVYSDPRMISYM